MDEPRDDLSFATDAAVLAELEERFDYMVFIGLKEHFSPNHNHVITLSSKGQPHVCMGLCHDALSRLVGNIEVAHESERDDQG
jgi:hypothetical protein